MVAREVDTDSIYSTKIRPTKRCNYFMKKGKSLEMDYADVRVLKRFD